MDEKLTKKEKDFCRFYYNLRSPRQAAYLAGWMIFPEKHGEALLEKERIINELKRFEERDADLKLAKAGFRRLAFGNTSDAIRLIDGDRTELEGMDLFMISDIKIPKGGGMEIKFFDRLKALECLATMEIASDTDGAMPFYKALEKSAELASKAAYTYEGDNNEK